MKMKLIAKIVCIAWAGAASVFAQGLPTSQPDLLQIIREEIKVGHSRDHVKVESGWPAAYAKAKSPDYYVALESLTGTSEVWFALPFASHAALGDSMKRESDDPVLAAELARLSRADAEHISGLRTIHAVARKELSHGSYPDTAKQRFYEITIFRVRPGHEADFEAAAKAYGSALGRVSPEAGFRVYEVVAGMPGPAFLVFSSVRSFAEFDKMVADDQATMKGMTAQEQAALQKFEAEGMNNAETHRFRLDPEMSYVPQATRDSDAAFWKPKKEAKPAPKPAAKPEKQ
jgi:hypothetical protein